MSWSSTVDDAAFSTPKPGDPEGWYLPPGSQRAGYWDGQRWMKSPSRPVASSSASTAVASDTAITSEGAAQADADGITTGRPTSGSPAGWYRPPGSPHPGYWDGRRWLKVPAGSSVDTSTVARSTGAGASDGGLTNESPAHREPDPPAPQQTLGGFRYGAATLLLVGGVSTVTQVVAAASLRLPIEAGWSTGGLIALVAGIWMWIRCRSWAAWRKWVWVPVVLTVVVAFVTINLMATNAPQPLERESVPQQTIEEDNLEAVCSSAESQIAEMTAAHESLVDRTWEYSQDRFRRPGWVPEPPTGEPSGWEEVLEESGVPTRAEVWEYYASAGGPQLEDEIAQFEAAYQAECLVE